MNLSHVFPWIPASSPLRRLNLLPTELLVEILMHSPSILALANLVIAFPWARSLLCSKFQREILVNTIRANATSENGRLVFAVMCLRRRDRDWNLHGQNVFRMIFVEAYTDPERPIKDMGGEPRSPPWLDFEDPLPALLDIAKVSQGIESLVESFAQTRILGPITALALPLSHTEATRIRRALWSFQVCYEYDHPEGRNAAVIRQILPRDSARFFRHLWYKPSSSSHDSLEYKWIYKQSELRSSGIHCTNLSSFLEKLSNWEIDELNAVRCHLVAEANALQYKRQSGANVEFSEQPVVLQQLIYDLAHWGRASISKDHILIADIRFPTYPSAVSAHYVGNGKANLANTTQRGRLLARHDEPWGWCMWDEERLTGCNLLLDPGPEADKACREVHEALTTDKDRWLSAKWRKDLRLTGGERRAEEAREAEERLSLMERPERVPCSQLRMECFEEMAQAF